MPTDAEILALLPRAPAYGQSTWSLAMDLRRDYPTLSTRALRARMVALCRAGLAQVQERRSNRVVWVRV